MKNKESPISKRFPQPASVDLIYLYLARSPEALRNLTSSPESLTCLLLAVRKSGRIKSFKISTTISQFQAAMVAALLK